MRSIGCREKTARGHASHDADHEVLTEVDHGEARQPREDPVTEREHPQPYQRDAYQGNYADIHGTPAELVWRVSPPVNGTQASVLLSLTNIGGNDVCLPSLAPWSIKDDQDSTIFTPAAAAVIDTLKPGFSRVWAWEKVTP